MEIYNVIIEDRHYNVEVLSFRNRDAAIEIAKDIAKERNTYPEDLKEEVIESYEYYVEYSCENDCVSVVKTILEE